MNAKHTPGPWNAIQRQDGSFWVQGQAVNESAFRSVCELGNSHFGYPKQYAEANARLISAAPDLLEALALLLAERYHCDEEAEFTPDGFFTCTSPASERARKAMHKATGIPESELAKAETLYRLAKGGA